MVPIQFPEPAFRIRERLNRDEIFDIVRKQWVVLTPEEWVRQKFIQYLHEVCHVSYALMAIEKQVSVGELSRRFDIAVYSNMGLPRLLIECKSPDVVLSGNTVSQMLSYVSVLQCPFFFITNGNQTHGWEVKNGLVSELAEFPLLK